MAVRPASWIWPAVSGLLLSAAIASGVTPAEPAGAAVGPAQVRLAGIVPAAVASSRPLGPAPGSMRLSLQVDLPLRHFAQLEASVAGLSDPGSPYFQDFLTPSQLTAEYGPTRSQLARVEAFLRSGGVTITSVSPQRNMIDAAATVSVADRVFGVRVWRWRQPGGRTAFAPRANPVLPASVAPLVLAVAGLDDFAQAQPDTVTCTTNPAGGAPSGTCAEPAGAKNLGYSPAQLQEAYGLKRLAGSKLCGSSTCDGKGQHIGILQFVSSWDPQNEAKFDSYYGLHVPSPSAKAICPSGVTCPIPVNDSRPNKERESDLDVEMAHAIAPGARVLVYQTTKDPLYGLAELLKTALNSKPAATTNSISYGYCESDFGSKQAYAMHQEFALLARHHQVFFAATGDSGKYCYTHKGVKQTGPSYPATDPLVTAVGGANLLLNSDNSYAYEYAWSESGGGASTYTWNTRPSWQKGPGIPAGKRRLVPDVSAEAFCSVATGCGGPPGYDYDITGPGTQYPNAGLGVSVRVDCVQIIFNGHCWASDGGTSAASPIWAAAVAVYNQYAEAAGKIPLDANVNARLYTLASHPQRHPGPITDITYKAENGSDLYENAHSGWDGATGVGSPQVYTMVTDLPGLAITPKTGPPGTAVTLTGTWFRPGETVTVAETTGTRTTICTATASSKGSFTCKGTIPTTSSTGSQPIQATGKTSDGQADAAFNVQVWTATEAPLPADAAAPPYMDINSVACPSASQCIAIGSYLNTSGNIANLALAGSGSSWKAIGLPLPSDARSDGVSGLDSLACASTTACSAVGWYMDSSNQVKGLALTWSGQSWQAAGWALPANANLGDSPSLGSISCPSATSCTAVGGYDDASNQYFDAVIVTGSGSSWTATEAPAPSNAVAPGADLQAIACPSATSCTAVGEYDGGFPGGGQGEILAWSGTSWTATEAPLPPHQAGATLNTVVCPSTSSCVAAGESADSAGNEEALLVSGSGSSWTSAGAALPSGAEAYGAQFNAISCASSSECAAVGNYPDTLSNLHPLLVTGSASSWTAANAPLPPDAITANSGPTIAAVQCPSATRCLAAGQYVVSGQRARGLLLTGSGSSWTPAHSPVPANAATDSDDALNALACPTTSVCVAVGYYIDSGFNTQGLIVTQSS